MSEQIDRLAKLSGDNKDRAPKYVVPLLKFNGNTGEFSTYNLETKAETPLERPVAITILMRRKALSAWTSTESKFSNEYSSTSQRVFLYKNIDGTITQEAMGTPAELRAKYPLLKTKEVIYCLLDGVIHKFEVKGASLRELWDFSGKLNEDGRHSFQVVIGLDSTKVVEKGKIPYFKMVFTDVGESDLDSVEENLAIVAENTGKIDAYFAEKIAAAWRAANGIGQTAVTNQPVRSQADEEYEALSADEPNPGDIPF